LTLTTIISAMNAQASAAPIPNAVRPSASFTAPLMNGPLPVKWREPPPKATHDAIDASIATMPRPSRYWTRRTANGVPGSRSPSGVTPPAIP